MSSEQTFSTSDLRSTAQDYKRDAARKHKWALGSVERRGTAEGHARPQRFAETIKSSARRIRCDGVASSQAGHKANTKVDLLEGTNITSSDDSSGPGSSASDYDDTPLAQPVDANVMYSFDATHGPSKGSQILNVALAKAVEKYEERETVKMVKTEYEVLDSEGESVGLTIAKKGKGKNGKAKSTPSSAAAVHGEDEDYEFV